MAQKASISNLQLNHEILMFLFENTGENDGFFKASLLAKRFNLSERSIRRKIGEFRELGYDIKANSGPGGGYRLNKDNLLKPYTPYLIEKNQRQAWADIKTTIKGSDLVNKETALELLNRISFSSNLENDFEVEARVFASKELLEKVKAKIENVYKTLLIAIDRKQRVEIKYKSLNKSSQAIKWQEFRPERFQVFNGIIYVKGYYNTSSDSFRTLRLSRFEEIRLINKKYSFNENFIKDDKESYFSESIYKMYDVVLKIEKANHDLLDYKYGEDQKIVEKSDYFLLSFKMAGDLLIKKLVLEMGSHCELLKPQAIRLALKAEINKMKEKY